MRLLVLAPVLFMASACAVASSSAPTFAPGSYTFSGTISGLKGGQIGNPIAGAELVVVNGTNANAHVTSDGGGHYAFAGLESGRFTVSITAPGFVSASPIVDLYRDTEVNFALTPR